jgi:hypothetical protein
MSNPLASLLEAVRDYRRSIGPRSPVSKYWHAQKVPVCFQRIGVIRRGLPGKLFLPFENRHKTRLDLLEHVAIAELDHRRILDRLDLAGFLRLLRDETFENRPHLIARRAHHPSPRVVL